MPLLLLYILLYLWGIGASLWAAAEVSGFLKSHAEISSTAALDSFKRLARRNMYLALGNIAVLGVGILIGIVLIWQRGFFGFVLVAVTNAALLAAGLRGTNLEKRVRSLPVTDESLAREYRHVAEVWVKKPLPDF